MELVWSFHFLCHFGVVFAAFGVSLGQSCTFQSGLCGWISSGSGPRWMSYRDPNNSSSSSSSSSGESPSSYAYVTISPNTSGNGTAILQGPEVTTATTDAIEISFQYQLSDHSQGDLTNALSVRWSRIGGDFDDVWHTIGPTDSWVTTSLKLAQDGVSRFVVQFVAEINVPSQDAYLRIREAEVKIKHDSCASSPCLHSGLCFGNGLTFTCICTGGYRGEMCQILPGVPLSSLFRGRTSARGVTTAGPRNAEINITSMATIKDSSEYLTTSTDIRTSHVLSSLTSGRGTDFRTRGTLKSSTAPTSMELMTNPTSPRSTTNSSPSPCMRRSTVPTVTVAMTEAAIVTDGVTNIGTPIEDISATSTTTLESQQSTTHTSSTQPESTEATSTTFSLSTPELTSSDSVIITSPSPSVSDLTTILGNRSPLATDVVPDIPSTNVPVTTRSFTSTKTELISSITEDYHSTIPDKLTTSLESTESIRTTQITTLTSFSTERTTLEVSPSYEATEQVTQSSTTNGDVYTNTETTSLSPDNTVTSEIPTTSKISTEETPTSSYTSPDSISTESQTNDLVTQRFTTKEELSTSSDYTDTLTPDIVTTKTMATNDLSTEERTSALETSEYPLNTGARHLSTLGRSTSATTESHEFETLTTSETASITESSITGIESTEASITNANTEGSITDIPTTGIGVASTPSSSSSASPSTASSSLSSSSTTSLKMTSNLAQSSRATTASTNTLQTTDNISSFETEVIGSSQSSLLNSTSAPASGNEDGVNVPLTVGLSVTGAVGVVVATGTAIFIIRRARRVSYGVAE